MSTGISGNLPEVAQEAYEAIGPEDSGERWQLEPSQHAQNLSAKAAPLGDLLRSSRAQDIMARFEEYNAKSGKAQDTYLFRGHLKINATTLAIVAGAVLLLMPPFMDSAAWLGWAIPAVGAVQVLSLAAAAWAGGSARASSLFRDWMDARAHAEEARRELFDHVCDPAQSNATASGPIPLAQLQLEYFRRFQLDIQMRYYTERGAQHEKANNRMLSTGAFLALLLALIGAAIPFALKYAPSLLGQEGAGQDIFRQFGVSETALGAFLFILGAVLVATQDQKKMLSEDRRNFIRYEKTAISLRRQAARLDEVRTAVAKGDTAALSDFVADVNKLISQEHQQWLTR